MSHRWGLSIQNWANCVAPYTSVNGAQFYLSCAQLTVSGSGHGSPGPLVVFPGAYSPQDRYLLSSANILHEPWSSRLEELMLWIGDNVMQQIAWMHVLVHWFAALTGTFILPEIVHHRFVCLDVTSNLIFFKYETSK